MPAPPAEEESQFQQITAARKYIAEQALKQQAKKVSSPVLTCSTRIRSTKAACPHRKQRQGTERKEKKGKEQTTPFGGSPMRSLVIYWAISTCTYAHLVMLELAEDCSSSQVVGACQRLAM